MSENKKMLSDIVKSHNCTTYKYLGIFENNKAYEIINEKLEESVSDGAFVGLPCIYIEDGDIYTRIKGNRLHKAMRELFKK